jgi:hypothetical protein
MEDKMVQLVDETLERTIKDGLTTNNLDIVYKLSKIKYYTKEAKEMNNYGSRGYNDYSGRGPGHGSYGEYNRGYGEYNDGYNNYGRRGVDSKYRGYDHLDRMYNEYGNYSYGRERYGANEDTKKSLEYMLRSMEDFARMLKEEAQSPEEVQMIKQTAQRIAQM